jgi:prepilin-type N-terminal cleavage/methylation domain-containing protein
MFKFRPQQSTATRVKSGFTLIELLVVISIIGVLAALMITNLVGARTRAADAKKKSELEQLATSLRLYYNDYQSYPTGNGLINGNLAPGAAFTIAGTTYMKALPATYLYYSSAPFDSYLLIAKLGNVSDDQLAKNFARCCPAGNAPANCPATLTNEFILCE